MSKQLLIPNSINEFDLKKVKFLDKGGVYIEASVKCVRDGMPAHDELKYTKKAVAHNDLTDLKDRFKDFLLKAFHINTGFDVALKESVKAKHDAITNKLIDIRQIVEVTGLSFAGSESLEGVVVTGKMESFNKSKVAMNTPRIVFSSDKLGFESEVELLCEDVKKEVFKFLSEDKRADQGLFSTVTGSEQPKEELV